MKKRVKRIFKYATGDIVPEGAIYLASLTNGLMSFTGRPKETRYVWHYFLVEVEVEDHAQ